MIERELYIKNNVKDLKIVYVNQNFTENITSNGILSEKNLLRKTIYEYFFNYLKKNLMKKIKIFMKKIYSCHINK